MRKYTFSVEWSDGDSEHVGLCSEFPSLSWLEKTPEAALAGIRKMVAETVAELIEGGEPFPEPLTLITSSGRAFRLNTPEEEAAIKAGIAAEDAAIEQHAVEDDNPIATEADVARAVPFAEVISRSTSRPPKEGTHDAEKPDNPVDE